MTRQWPENRSTAKHVFQQNLQGQKDIKKFVQWGSKVLGSKKWYNFSKLAPSPLPPKQCWIVSKMGDHKIFEGGGLKKGWTQNPSNNCFCFSTLSKILLIAIVVIWTLTHLSPANWGKRQSNCQGQIKEILRKEATFYALPTSEDTTYKSKNSFRLKNLLSSIWPFPDHPRFCWLNKGKLEMVHYCW